MTSPEATRDETVAAERPSALLRAWQETSWLATALLLAFAIRACVIEPYSIPSGSMLPTLLIGDHLFVNKFVYGIRVPLVGWRLPGLRNPERGDVIVFSVARDGPAIYPADERPRLPRDRFVKRIVGLPGDVVEVRQGQVYLNGQPVPRHKTGRVFVDRAGRRLEVWEEELGRHRHAILDDPFQPGPDQPPIRVPSGRYFVMGDNRDFSNDSRFWGTVRFQEIKGPAFVLYWSWDWNGSWIQLLSPLTWWDNLLHRVRWSRIGHTIP